MSENQTKKTVHVFQVPEVSDRSPSMEPMGCGPGCGSGDFQMYNACSCGVPALDLDEMLSQFSEKHGHKADVIVADYSTGSAISKTLDALNLLLKESNEALIVTPANMEMVLAQSAPIIAIDGKIVSTRIVPAAEQLASAIDGDLDALAIDNGSCC